jgi:hypothetical protein
VSFSSIKIFPEFSSDYSLRENIQIYSFHSSFLIVFFIFSVLITQCIFLALGGRIFSFPVIFSFVVSVVSAINFLAKNNASSLRIIVYISTFLIFLATSFTISGKFYDISWDGQAYHQEAIIQLAGGWNPFYDASPASNRYLELTFYSKGSWIIAASIFKLTGVVEYGKALNWLLFFSAFLICLSALLRIKEVSTFGALSGATVLALNPVILYQLLGFYLDGQVAAVLTAVVAAGFWVIVKPGKLEKAMLFMLIVIGLNLKMTMVAYLVVAALGTSIIAIFICKNRLPVVVTICVLSFSTGFCFVGYSPYITNTINHGNPFYPVVGSESIDIISSQRPTNFSELNRVERLYLSLFGKPDWRPNVVSQPAIPFWIDKSHLTPFSVQDARVAGWGPLFSGAILIAGIGLIITGFNLRKKFRLIVSGLSVISFLLLSALVNPELWWARLAPQIYLIPIIISIILLSLNDLFSKIISYTIIIILILNDSLISYFYFDRNYKTSKAINEKMKILAGWKTPLDVYFGSFKSTGNRFKKAGILYNEVKSLEALTCRTKIPISADGFCCPPARLRTLQR